MSPHTKQNKDTNGNIVTSKQKPDILADYFEQVQWDFKKPDTDP